MSTQSGSRLRILLAVGVVSGLVTLALTLTPSGSGYTCIAPAAPGGGWDLTCRTVAPLLPQLGLVDGPFQVINLPGAGGGVACANVVAHRNKDARVLVATSLSAVLYFAQRRYGDLTEDHVRWLAALATDVGVLAVRTDSPYRNLPELIQAWRANPGALIVGGGSPVGGQDQMKSLVVARAAGISSRAIRYVPFDGGGEALTSLLGGFIDLLASDASEVVAQFQAGKIRVLAVLGSRRLGGPLARVPTASEAGVAVEWLNFRGFFVPGGISDADFARWTAAMRALASSPQWRRVRAQHNLQPWTLVGAEFDAFVRDQIARMRELSAAVGFVP